MLFFHIGTAWYGSSQLLATRDLHMLLSCFGGTQAYLPALLVVAVLLILGAPAQRPLDDPA